MGQCLHTARNLGRVGFGRRANRNGDMEKLGSGKKGDTALGSHVASWILHNEALSQKEKPSVIIATTHHASIQFTSMPELQNKTPKT